MQAFSDNPWFRSLPQMQAHALVDAAQPMKLGAGKVLYRQGDALGPSTPAFFGLASGSMKLSILNSDGKEGILTVIEPGNWIGEVALLDNTRRRAHNAIALDGCELAAVTAKAFEALMRDPEFARAVAKLVAARLRLAYEALAGQTLQSMRQRVARRLVMLAHGDITQSTRGRMHVSTSQDNLAMMLGVSRPTLSKELQALAKAGAIALRYGQIEILAMERLRVAGQLALSDPTGQDDFQPA
ncbi:MAG: Crp/Fnr family transcriptional regulator [Proteobacteria bacterium]|nr:Crp/Fnr family transcriptional regulator [Pseudomonadota bacterium]